MHTEIRGNRRTRRTAERDPASRLPPQNIEAEQSVLGSILLNNDVLDSIVTFLKPGDFYRGSHQEVYGAILTLYREGVGIDAVSLAEELTRLGRFGVVGGDDMLGRICEAAPHALNAEYHARIVKENAQKRALIEAANEILHDCYAAEQTAEDLVEQAERRVFAVADDGATQTTVSIATAAREAVSRLMTRGTGLTGLSSGFVGLDDKTDGLHPGQLIVVAARPSIGKTAWALSLADHVAVKRQRAVLYVSLEMTQVEIADRMLVMRSLVPHQRLRYWGSLRPDETSSVASALDALDSAPLHIDEAPERTTLQIMANARRLKARGELDLLVIDYLQLITPADEHRESRTESVARISRELKRIARELRVPLIAIAQLNRAVETREDRRPRMADVKESGQIEQDADLLLLLHRPDYYDRDDKPGEAELIIAKNRNGETGTVPLGFVRELGRFTDLVPPLEAF